MRGAVILAGGQSKRFQSDYGQWADKALAILFGKPLLVHIVENVKPVVDEILICVDDHVKGLRYMKVLEDYSITGIKICIDMKFSLVKGPFAAIATGLKESRSDCCIILPCDTPLIKPSVVDHLLSLVEDLDISVPVHPDGSIETLMFSCKRGIAARIAETLCLFGRSRPVDIIRASSKIKFVSTISELKKLDPDLKSFVNINFRSDLNNLPTRFSKEGPIVKSICLNIIQPSPTEISSLEEVARKYSSEYYLEALNGILEALGILEQKGAHFWTGVLWETAGKIYHAMALKEEPNKMKEYYIESKMAFEKAALKYAAESEIYRDLQIKFLYESARGDEIWCLKMKEATAPIQD